MDGFIEMLIKKWQRNHMGTAADVKADSILDVSDVTALITLIPA